MSRTTSRRARLITVTALAALPLALAAVPAQAVPTATDLPAAAQGSIPGAWIVTLEDGASENRVSSEHSRRFDARVEHVYRHALHGYAAQMSDSAAASVARDPRVASIERDRAVAITGQTVPTGVRRIEAPQSSTAAGTGTGLPVDVDVAVIDTGIDTNSTDLERRTGIDCVTSGGSAQDGHGHGTHVAGTIGAKDNGEGVVGVAPGARVWAVRVLDDAGSGTRAGILCGIDWVTGSVTDPSRERIEVANMSLGGSGTEPRGSGCATRDAYHDAICKSVAAGVTYVVAAGNSSSDAKNFVPAAYDEVITVSALADSDGAPGGVWSAACRTDVEETLADFSNFGADVDLIAPGVCIESTKLGGGTTTMSGTSMASPHVAGAAALFLAGHRGTSPAAVKTALLGASEPWAGAGDRDRVREPLVNVDAF